MIFTALSQTWAQLLHPTFRKVFFISATIALIVLLMLNYGAWVFWPEGVITGIDWIDESLRDSDWASTVIFAPIMMIVSYFMFPPVATAVMGLMNDQVADAVEEEYYPHRPASRSPDKLEAFVGALKLALVVVIVNMIALVPYLLLFFMTGGLGSLLLYLLINGYLLGREYFEMVAVRHVALRDVKPLRKMHQSKMMMAGMTISGLFLIPFVNILAPILGTAIMTHAVHAAFEEEGR